MTPVLYGRGSFQFSLACKITKTSAEERVLFASGQKEGKIGNLSPRFMFGTLNCVKRTLRSDLLEVGDKTQTFLYSARTICYFMYRFIGGKVDVVLVKIC